jgi:hypothetical protein
MTLETTARNASKRERPDMRVMAGSCENLNCQAGILMFIRQEGGHFSLKFPMFVTYPYCTIPLSSFKQRVQTSLFSLVVGFHLITKRFGLKKQTRY